eukprot:CAMPEP_0194270246 /NCGR_PEP_ID=MMETSP0169-20130528/4267_1 /TAXON_ID=218684 /ORGANISM="Corethron pennatum, Strain L29A3" /LENGTH=466 /DNA_ID=CAMNT_0039012219 /DNA_START=348 /DNA_END=1748 /DNA_ORIENTATION=-
MPHPGFFSTANGKKYRMVPEDTSKERFTGKIVPPNNTVVNLGLIGTGSHVYGRYWHCRSYSVSHKTCLDKWFHPTFDCGERMKSNAIAGRHIFDQCGLYAFRAQLGYVYASNNTDDDLIFMPQVENSLDIIIQNSESSFVLTIRKSPETWARNIMRNYFLRDAFINSDIKGLPVGKGGTVEELVAFYNGHSQFISSLLGEKLTVINTDDEDWEYVKRKPDTNSTCGVENVWKEKIATELFSISSGKRGGVRTAIAFDKNNPPKLKLPTPVISVGMPKSGTTSLFNYFNCGGHATSHYLCSKGIRSFRCGECIQKNIRKGTPLLRGCGKFEVWAEINSSNLLKNTIFLPQVENLDLIHGYYPNATFVLTYRDPEDWVKSVVYWHELKGFLLNSNITGLSSRSDDVELALREFYVTHMERIRQFVQDHPSHKLVQVNLSDKNAGKILQDSFGVNETCWGHSNKGDYKE